MKLDSHPLRWALLIALASILLFAPSVSIGFLGDDYQFLLASRTAGQMWGSFTGDWFWGRLDIEGPRFYRPIQIALVYLEQNVFFGHAAWGYHLINLLVHAGCSVLVGALALQLIPSNRPGRGLAAWTAAAVFALHPRHCEAVCMINGRTDSVCALFYLTSLTAYIHGRETRRGRWLAVSAAALIAALLSKEMAITLPAIMTAYEFTAWRRARRNRENGSIRPRAVALAVPVILTAAIFGGLRTWALGGYIFGRSGYITPHTHLSVYLVSMTKIITVLAAPFDVITVPLSNTLNGILFSNHSAAVLMLTPVAAIVLFTMVWGLWRGGTITGVALTLWFIAPLPILSQFPELHSNIGDRYLYIPSAGVALLAGLLLQRASTMKRPARLALGAALAVWMVCAAAQTLQYERYWRAAGDIGARVARDLDELDRTRRQDETFFILAIPAYYHGATIHNSALAVYLEQNHLLRGEPRRIMPSMLSLMFSDHPMNVTTETVIEDGRLIHSVTGGGFAYPTLLGGDALKLDEESFRFLTPKAEFIIGNVDFPLTLLAYERGHLTIAHEDRYEILAAQGPGGGTKVERIRLLLGSQVIRQTFSAQYEQLRTDFKHEDWRGVHLSTGDLDLDGCGDAAVSYTVTEKAETEYPGIVVPISGLNNTVMDHPFVPFEEKTGDIAENPLGSVKTAIGAFIPGEATPQIAAAQGEGAYQLVRIYRRTNMPAPNGYYVSAQCDAFDDEYFDQNEGHGVEIAGGDLDGDGITEIVTGQTPGGSVRAAIGVLEFGELGENGLAPLIHRSETLALADALGLPDGVGATLTTGDFDGDGELEIAAGVSSYQSDDGYHPPRLAVLEVEHAEGFVTRLRLISGGLPIESAEAVPGGVRTLSLTSGDVDGDGIDEIIVAPGEADTRETYRRVLNSPPGGETPKLMIQAYDVVYDASGLVERIEPRFDGGGIDAFPTPSDDDRGFQSIDVSFLKRY
ncbi:MAG: hypothetical protein GC154_07365 [bacterium]|nr:hypothetical protein [bacterium]